MATGYSLPSVKLHPLTFGAAPQVLQFFKLIVNTLRQDAIYQWDESYPDKMILERDLTCGHAFGMYDNDELVAYVALNNEYPPAYEEIPWCFPEPALIVHRLAIHPCARRIGMAKAVMIQSESYASQNGYLSMRLDAFVNNPAALALYGTLGYVERGTLRFRHGMFRCFEKEVSVSHP